MIGFLRDHLAGSKKVPPKLLCQIFYVKIEESLLNLKSSNCLNTDETVNTKQPKCPIARCESSEST